MEWLKLVLQEQGADWVGQTPPMLESPLGSWKIKERREVIYSFSSYLVPEISAVSWAFIETNERCHLNVEHLQRELEQ